MTLADMREFGGGASALRKCSTLADDTRDPDAEIKRPC